MTAACARPWRLSRASVCLSVCLHAPALSLRIAQARPAIYSLLGWLGSASWEIMCHAGK